MDTKTKVFAIGGVALLATTVGLKEVLPQHCPDIERCDQKHIEVRSVSGATGSSFSAVLTSASVAGVTGSFRIS